VLEVDTREAQTAGLLRPISCGGRAEIELHFADLGSSLVVSNNINAWLSGGPEGVRLCSVRRTWRGLLFAAWMSD